MTHYERRIRREKIAACVKEQGSTWKAVASAARKFGVSERTVEESCHEWKVRLKRTPQAPKDVVLKIVADLMNTHDTLTDIAERHRVTPQYVSQLYCRCRKVKIELFPRVVGGQRKG